MDSAPGEVTLLLFEVKNGHREAEDRLIPLVYNELRKIARSKLRRESADNSLQPTALVHEAYLRLTRMDKIDWQGRSHFYGVAARQMRHVLVDHAKEKNAEKRGPGKKIAGLDSNAFAAVERGREIVALDDALAQLSKVCPRSAQVVDLRFFTGLTAEEIAPILGVSAKTVKRDWTYARTWLFRELSANNKQLNEKQFLKLKPNKRGDDPQS